MGRLLARVKSVSAAKKKKKKCVLDHAPRGLAAVKAKALVKQVRAVSTFK